jgi:hypothetical protein
MSYIGSRLYQAKNFAVFCRRVKFNENFGENKIIASFFVGLRNPGEIFGRNKIYRMQK